MTAFVPQGLPICVALALTITAKKMAKEQILVKNLSSIETLGCISNLLSDKTGTLTLGKMSVEKIGFLDCQLSVPNCREIVNSTVALMDLHKVSRLCNGARFEGGFEESHVDDRPVTGDSTDSVNDSRKIFWASRF